MAYENFWTRRNRESEARAKAVLDGARAEADVLAAARAEGGCAALNKSGNPCKGFATETGLCAGHQNAVDNGKQVQLAGLVVG